MEYKEKEMISVAKEDYELLKSYAAEMSAQAQKATEQLKRVYESVDNTLNIFKRLDYLFKVVENHNAFNEDFLNKVIEEIQYLMTAEDKEDGSEDK